MKAIEPFRAVLLLKKCDRNTNMSKEEAWVEITKRYNESTPFEARTNRNLQFRWKNLRKWSLALRRKGIKTGIKTKFESSETSDTDHGQDQEAQEGDQGNNSDGWMEYVEDVKDVKAEEMSSHIDDDPLDEISTSPNEPKKKRSTFNAPPRDLLNMPTISSNVINTSLSLSDQLMQAQINVAKKECEYLEAKTLFLKRKIRGCQCLIDQVVD